jgi:hypothetical protein
VEAFPLVRSSYHASEQVKALSLVHHKMYGEAALGGRIIEDQQSAVQLIQGDVV